MTYARRAGLLPAFALLLSSPGSGSAQVAPLLIEHDVTVQTMTSDRFTWIDSGGQQRVAVLAHNDSQVAGPGGTKGGELREYRYQVNGQTRVVSASSKATAGFGYVVSHPDNSETCLGGVDSSALGHLFGGTWTRVFEGRHHVIFRFQQKYPRYCTTGGAAENDIPVTLEWVFSTGRDHPLWAITYDLTAANPQIAAGTLLDDSRAPYGEMMFDGSTDPNTTDTIGGVSWGDQYKFFSTTVPVTMNSAWTWNTPNTVPYVKLWMQHADATMGTVQTQTMAQQDAGGYFGEAAWGKTSASYGSACLGFGNDHVMPCDFNWDFQSINYEFANNVTATNSPRLAWGTEFGFLGQSQYRISGDSYYGGPINPDQYASGWPRKSYSTYVVLGTHSSNPVEAQVTQIETIQNVTLTATTGNVVTIGPAGANRSDTVTYAPAGYNHVYGALAFSATGNQLDANINVGGAGTLTHPLMIVGSYTGTFPPSVKLNGTTLTSDVDYFASTRTSPNELWITLNRNLTGATNRLQIDGTSGIPATPTVVATASGATVNISWNSASATGYDLERSDNVVTHGWSTILSNTSGTSYGDIVSGNTAYAYRVRARNASGTSAYGYDVATTVSYTNAITTGGTVSAVDLAELRHSVDLVRALANYAAGGYTDPANPGVTIKAIHITELRTQLDQALGFIGVPLSAYTDNPLVGVPVKAVHFQELRNRMQ